MIISHGQLCAYSFSEKQAHLSSNLLATEHAHAVADYLGCSVTGGAIALELSKYGELSYSRDKGRYIARYNSDLSRLKLVTEAVDFLELEGLIIHDKKKPGTGNRGRQSSMIATDCLHDIAAAALSHELVTTLPRLPPKELVILRDVAKKNADYTDTKRTRAMRKKLKAYNELLMGTHITGAEIGPMVRVFNESWKRGGRAYGLWQNVPKLEREKFLISGKHTVELDYRAIHPTLLYAQKGLSVPADCYDVSGVDRWKVKLALLILINSDSLRSAALALAAEVNNRERGEHGLPILTDIEQMPQSAIDDAYKVIAATKQRHKPIAEFFHSGVGIKLQEIDAAIAEAVWWTMFQRDILVLPIHDSFVVEVGHANMLESVMLEAAERLSGHMIPVTK